MPKPNKDISRPLIFRLVKWQYVIGLIILAIIIYVLLSPNFFLE